MLHVFIVEDEPVIGRHLKSSIENDHTQTRLFSLGTELIKELAEGNLPDIILMDINLPDTTGVELTRMIKEKYPNIEIIMQTVNEENNVIISAIEAGASGYLLKTSDTNEIRQALDTVMEGGSFLTGKIARKILQKFLSSTQSSIDSQKFGLTPSEENILNELIKGAKNKEIATKCGITPHTVKMHLRSVYKKMYVNSRSEAVSKALQNKD